MAQTIAYNTNNRYVNIRGTESLFGEGKQSGFSIGFRPNRDIESISSRLTGYCREHGIGIEELPEEMMIYMDNADFGPKTRGFNVAGVVFYINDRSLSISYNAKEGLKSVVDRTKSAYYKQVRDILRGLGYDSFALARIDGYVNHISATSLRRRYRSFSMDSSGSIFGGTSGTWPVIPPIDYTLSPKGDGVVGTANLAASLSAMGGKKRSIMGMPNAELSADAVRGLGIGHLAAASDLAEALHQPRLEREAREAGRPIPRQDIE